MMLNLVLKSPIKCCILSTEMPAHEIHIRMMSIISKVESYKIERAKKEVEQRVSDAIVSFTQREDCNIYDSFMYEDLESIIAKEASLGTKIVFIDYLQQIRSNQKQDSINNYIGKITGLFKALAIKYGIAVVVLAQLNRQVGE
jgi:replicative DNA helicase